MQDPESKFQSLDVLRGTSQSERVCPALDPGYVQLDARSWRDDLEFAKEYGKHLRYLDVHGHTQSFSGFLESVEPADVEALFRDPGQVPADSPLFRPHVSLFLVFLQLLARVRTELNTLTSEHLDFYFRKVLGMTMRPALADRVHLVFELSPRSGHVLVPGGTLLSAGRDAEGRELSYATERDLVITRAQVVSVRSVCFHRERAQQPRDWVAELRKQKNGGATLAALIGFALGETGPNSRRDEDAIGRLVSDLTALDFAALQAAATPTEPEKKEWEAIYRLLEVAGRNRLKGAPPVSVTSFNLYSQTLPSAVADHPWHTFGELPAQAQSNPPPSLLGWAIRSPLLRLSEGTRRLTVVLSMDYLSDVHAINARMDAERLFARDRWRFEVSTARGWVALPAGLMQAAPDDDKVSLTFWLVVSPGTEPLCASGAEPALRCMLLPQWESKGTRWQLPEYDELSRWRVARAHLQVTVEGLRSLSLQNDEGAIDPSKPFEPFGRAPMVGSRLTIAHAELAAEHVAEVTFKPEWLELPKPSPSHTIALGVAGTQGESVKLFAGPIQGKGQADVWQWQLDKNDFGHAAYPATVAANSLLLAVAMANAKDGETPVLKDGKRTLVPLETRAKELATPVPYAPRLTSLSVDYKTEIVPVELWHVHPFGEARASAETLDRKPGGPVGLLPRYADDGELYIGLAQAREPQTLSLLFQLADGSSDPDALPQTLHWSYLEDNAWQPFDAKSVRDSTRGLLNSGIVALSLGAQKPSLAASRLPSELRWVRATISTAPGSVCRSLAIVSQAVTATFVADNAAREHYAVPLPAASIKQLSTRIAGIAAVRQPYTSFGGRVPEEPGDPAWATRVSERLRHKGRALTGWDYERLALDAFPELYKVACVSQSQAEPGEVRLVVIPDVRQVRPADPFAPKASADLLARVKERLQARAPTFARVSVRNPRYVALSVRVAVRFCSAGDSAYYVEALKEELCRFLSPWAFADAGGEDIELGGRIYASSIVDYVQRRTYVEHVAGVWLSRSAGNGESTILGVDASADELFAQAEPDEVIGAAREHFIDVLGEDQDELAVWRGIGFMRVGVSFTIAASTGGNT